MNIETCDRCDSKIIEEQFKGRDEYLRLTRNIATGEFGIEIESEDVRLCSMCWDDLWEWALGDGTPDRSDRADPMPLDRMADSVERHIEDLEGVLDQLSAAVGDTTD